MTIFEMENGRFVHSSMLKMAIRACVRLLDLNSEGWEEAEAADAQWDGGEWSGPAHANMHQEEEERVVKLVACRFDISAFQLGEALMGWQYTENDCYLESVLNNTKERYDV